MKLFLIPVCLLYMATTIRDTTFVRDSQVKKIENKAKEIKAQPYKHSVEDVYGLLFKSIDLNKQLALKTDSANKAIADLKQDNAEIRRYNAGMSQSNASMIAMLTNLQNSDQRDSEKMYLVNKYIESLPLAFAGTVLLFVAIILLKRNFQIAT